MHHNDLFVGNNIAIAMRSVAMQLDPLARFLRYGRAISSSYTCTDSIIQQRLFSDKKGAKGDDGPKLKQVKVKKKDKSKKEDESGKSKEYNLIISALDAPVRKEPPISDDEKARRHEIGRNYNIGRFRFHNQVQQDLTFKIHLKKHAINMLPRDSKIKEEALKENDEAPPPWRLIPSWTPPIPNFDPSKYMVKDEDK